MPKGPFPHTTIFSEWNNILTEHCTVIKTAVSVAVVNIQSVQCKRYTFLNFQSFCTRMVWKCSEYMILAILDFLQSFSTNMVKKKLEHPILAILNFFQYFCTRMVHKNLECPILAVLHFFQYFFH